MKFSVVIPVFNRPGEVEELLESLKVQSNMNFEVIIVEDGSNVPCKDVVDKYVAALDLKYYFKTNSGPGTTRNYGAQRCKGDYIVFFDSDCIIPPHYFEEVEQSLSSHFTDAYGGPDATHPSFTITQKAIGYAMTSFFTTGGIRGGKRSLEKFAPRSFNMGISREAFINTGGYSDMRFGEDIDMSLRILQNGFKTQLIANAFVYHKRRTDLKKFFKQVHNSGIARINLFKRHPNSLKIVHLLPSLFTVFCVFFLLASLFLPLAIFPLVIFSILILIDASIKNGSFSVGIVSVMASFVQLFGYGTGFLKSFWIRIVLRRGEFHAFKNNFYK